MTDETINGDGSQSNPWFEHFDRVATGSEQCPYSCPVCMGLSLVKQMRPEVASHLIAASREFFLAAKAFIDSLDVPGESSRGSRVEKIRIEDENPS